MNRSLTILVTLTLFVVISQRELLADKRRITKNVGFRDFYSYVQWSDSCVVGLDKYWAPKGSEFVINGTTKIDGTNFTTVLFLKVPSPADGDRMTVKINCEYVIRAEFFQEGAVYERFSSFKIVPVVVPFKYWFSDGGSIAPEASLGVCLGKPIKIGSAQMMPLIGVGAGSVSVPGADASDVDSKACITLVLGIAFQIESNVQIAAVLGTDTIGKHSPSWKYNNKPWVSIAIGFNILR